MKHQTNPLAYRGWLVSLACALGLALVGGIGLILGQVSAAASPVPEAAAHAVGSTPFQPYRVRDINTSTGPASLDWLTRVGEVLFFAASDDAHGSELWVSDGTLTGTQLVRDIHPGEASAELASLTEVNGTLFFNATDGEHGPELWMSDGTLTGTVMVKDIVSGSLGSDPASLTDVNGTLFFSAGDELGQRSLWKSDGTPAGTVRVSPAAPEQARAVGEALFFVSSDPDHGRELWVSDGTLTGTLLVKDIVSGTTGSHPEHLTAFQGRLAFGITSGENGDELWTSDGTLTGTQRVSTLVPGAASGMEGMVNINSLLIIASEQSGFDEQLWRSDGTLTGTVMITNGLAYADPMLTASGEYAYFSLWSDACGDGYTLWRTDGFAIDPLLVGPTCPDPQGLTDLNGELYFSAYEEQHGRELWKSDGTLTGTLLVKDIRPGVPGSTPARLAAAGGLPSPRLFLAADDGLHGEELWASDGTPTGTQLVKDIFSPTDSSDPALLTPVTGDASQGRLFFAADGGDVRSGLWRSDGTFTGTRWVSGVPPYEMAAVGETLFLRGHDSQHGFELWISDGTLTGTLLVKDINYGPDSASPGSLTPLGSQLFFSANDFFNGYELWKSDGTPGGTLLVKNIYPNSGNSSPGGLAVAGGLLFFHAEDGVAGRELWVSDGSEAGTHLTLDIYPGVSGAHPEHLVAVGDTLFFTAQDGEHGRELWRSDGTPGGTFLVKDIFPGSPGSDPAELTAMGGSLYFTAEDGLHGRELWRSDGTSAGTVMVIAIGDEWGGPAGLAVVDGGGESPWLFFFAEAASDPAFGASMLWVSDGTLTGTQQVRDINPGDEGPAFNGTPVGAGGYLFFIGNDSASNFEVWVSDGTLTGTLGLTDFSAESQEWPPPSNLTPLGDRLFFTAHDRPAGTELWALDLPVPIPNQAPIAADDAISTTQATGVLIPVLDNDHDPDGDPLSIEAVGEPLSGTAHISGTQVSYLPAAEFTGMEVFTYTITDGRQAFDTALITVTVVPAWTPVNLPRYLPLILK